MAGSAGFPVTYEVTCVTCEWFERKEPYSHLSQMPFVTNVCVVDVSHLFSRVCHMPDRMTVSTMTVHREGFSCREQTRRLRHLESRPLCLLQWAAVPRKRAPSWRPRRLLMSHSQGLGHIPHPRRQSLEDGVGFPAWLSSGWGASLGSGDVSPDDSGAVSDCLLRKQFWYRVLGGRGVGLSFDHTFITSAGESL